MHARREIEDKNEEKNEDNPNNNKSKMMMNKINKLNRETVKKRKEKNPLHHRMHTFSEQIIDLDSQAGSDQESTLGFAKCTHCFFLLHHFRPRPFVTVGEA
jgi:hypothetical protein